MRWEVAGQPSGLQCVPRVHDGLGGLRVLDLMAMSDEAPRLPAVEKRAHFPKRRDLVPEEAPGREHFSFGVFLRVRETFAVG